MADLNTGAFSAVESFFGVTTETQTTSKPDPKPPLLLKHSRLGVGVRPTTSKSLDTASIDAKRILQVGRKREALSDEEEASAVHSEHSDDEEEFGRTAIHEKSDPPIVKELPKKKRKLGKKERQKQQQNSVEATETVTEETTNDPSFIKSNQTELPQRKRRRRKVRSRQKNIYKDHRDVKPDHLTIGSVNYRGRPLTQETRQKLCLPSIDKQPPTWASHWNESLDSKPLAVEQTANDGTAKNPKRDKASRYKNL